MSGNDAVKTDWEGGPSQHCLGGRRKKGDRGGGRVWREERGEKPPGLCSFLRERMAGKGLLSSRVALDPGTLGQPSSS